MIVTATALLKRSPPLLPPRGQDPTRMKLEEFRDWRSRSSLRDLAVALPALRDANPQRAWLVEQRLLEAGLQAEAAGGGLLCDAVDPFAVTAGASLAAVNECPF